MFDKNNVVDVCCDIMNEQFNHGDILRIYPWIKPRTLIYWSERGLIQPDFSDASGRGSSRLYSYTNVIEIGIVSELLVNGIPFKRIKEIMTSSAIQEMKETKYFDIVIYTDHRMFNNCAKKPSADRRSAPETSGTIAHPYYAICTNMTIFSTADSFLQNGGHRLIGVGNENVTSAVIINVKGIKIYVEAQIGRG